MLFHYIPLSFGTQNIPKSLTLGHWGPKILYVLFFFPQEPLILPPTKIRQRSDVQAFATFANEEEDAATFTQVVLWHDRCTQA